MSDDAARPTRTIALCAAMHGVGGGLGWSLVPALMPEIAVDLRISHAMGGVVWGAASLGIALAAPLGGAAVDRYGARRVAGLATLCGAATCAARVLVSSGVGLAVAMFCFGVHVAFVAPAIPKALAGDVPLRKLGRANGLALLAYTGGTALSIASGRALSAALGGFRHVMLAAAVAMSVVAVVWLLSARDRTAAIRHASVRSVLALGRLPAMRRIGAVHFLLFGGYLALLGVLPRALIEAGLPPSRASLAVAGWLVVAAAANAIGPWISDRIGRRKPIVIVGAIVAASALAALAIAPPGAAPLFLAIAAVGGGAFAPLLMTMPAELPEIGVARAGAALGLLMLIGQVGGFALPAIAGAVLQSRGFGATLALLALAHLAIVLPALGLRETGRAGREPAPLPTLARGEPAA